MTVRQKYHNAHPALRWTFIILGILILILLILQLLISIFADDYLATKLKQGIRSSSPYVLQIDDLDVNLFSGSVRLSNIHIFSDSTTHLDTLSIHRENTLNNSIKSIDIQGISLLDYFFNNRLSIDEIVLTQPLLTGAVNIPGKNSSNPKNRAFPSIDSLILSSIHPRFEALGIDRFVVKNAQLMLENNADEDTLAAAGRFDLTLTNIRVDSASAESGRKFITDDISVQLEDGFYRLSNFYYMKLGNLEISSPDQTVEIDSLQLIPQYPKFQFGQINKYEIDRIDLVITELSIEKFNISKLVKNGRIEAENLTISNANLVDFRNKSLPFPPGQRPPLPHTGLRNLDLTLKIDTIRMKDSYIAYNEYWKPAPQAGTITFEHLNATITNVTNYPGLIEKGMIMKMEASAQVMGRALLDTHFEFPMNTKTGFHRIEGSLTTMPVTALNPILKYVAFAKVDGGVINHLEFEMTLTDSISNGTLVMNYEDLKISVLDEETMQQTGVLADIKSLLTNIVIVPNNTPEDGMRPGTIRFERVQKKSFFNYWWKSLYSGMKDVILD